MTKWYEERRPVIIHSATPPGAWKIFTCAKFPTRQIGYWDTGRVDHSDDICPHCGGAHFQ